MESLRIILADDHVLLRQGLRRILEEMPGLQVVAEAGDGEELLRLLEGADAQLAMVDISMEGLGGIQAIREIRKRFPEVKILVLTMHRDKEYLQQALSAGAHGYMLKEDADSELFSAIKRINEGRIYISSILREDLAEQWVETVQKGNGHAAASRNLTVREKEVLKLIADGKSSREIAEMFHLSPRTVERHRANIMRKLDLKRVADVVKYALNKKYI